MIKDLCNVFGPIFLLAYSYAWEQANKELMVYLANPYTVTTLAVIQTIAIVWIIYGVYTFGTRYFD